jgi:hypothetical protein
VEKRKEKKETFKTWKMVLILTWHERLEQI